MLHSPAARKRPKILVVERDVLMADQLTQTLTRLGYDVTAVAKRGDEAAEMIAQNTPDLLLADLGPEGEGDGAAIAARARDQWKIPAVFLTAYADLETMRARLAEPYWYLVKPVAEQDLQATIEIALQQRGLAAKREEQTIASTQLLERTQEELAAAAARAFHAQEQERERIARDLHDDFAQRLAILQIQIEGMEQKLPSDLKGNFEAAFRTVCRDIEKLGSDLRDLSHRLHPSILDDLGLTRALRQLADDFTQRYSMPVQVSSRSVPAMLPHTVKLALYRITQEALQNVAKHAGPASVNVALTAGPRGLDLSIRDTGKGFQPQSPKRHGGLGLVSMAQRAELIGGAFKLRSQPGEGTQIHVHIPIDALDPRRRVQEE